MVASDLVELKRACAPDKPHAASSGRPTEPAPSFDAPPEARETWAFLFVPWFLEMTGGDQHPDGGPAGHRWRMEFFECMRDPQAFEQYAEHEIAAYRASGGV